MKAAENSYHYANTMHSSLAILSKRAVDALRACSTNTLTQSPKAYESVVQLIKNLDWNLKFPMEGYIIDDTKFFQGYLNKVP